MVRYQAYLDKPSFTELKQIAKRRGESTATLLREAVREFVEKRAY